MLIEAYPEYIIGHIKSGHYELEISEKLYEELKANQCLEEYIYNHGDLLIDDTVIDDMGPLYDIKSYR